MSKTKPNVVQLVKPLSSSDNNGKFSATPKSVQSVQKAYDSAIPKSVSGVAKSTPINESVTPKSVQPVNTNKTSNKS
jgi:hypothetical protein